CGSLQVEFLRRYDCLGCFHVFCDACSAGRRCQSSPAAGFPWPFEVCLASGNGRTGGEPVSRNCVRDQGKSGREGGLSANWQFRAAQDPARAANFVNDSEELMRRIVCVIAVLLGIPAALPWLHSISGDEPVLFGFSAESSRAERQWEEKFKAIPSPQLMRDYMQRLSAQPHHVGASYDRDNAEWLAAKFKEFGLDTHIETFDILFPTPKERAVELVEGGPKFVAKLQEPVVPQDPTSNQQNAQLPTYNAYSIDGDVTAPLVFVNYGIPEDYEQ